MCERDRKAGISCPYFSVSYTDVHELHFYHDRWSTDPEHLPATAIIVSNQPAHVTLLEPIVTPAMPSGPGSNTGFTLTVRGRLDNALEGEYDPALSPETTTIAQLNPGVTDGLKGMKTRVELIAAGTEVPVQVRLGPSGGLYCERWPTQFAG